MAYTCYKRTPDDCFPLSIIITYIHTIISADIGGVYNNEIYIQGKKTQGKYMEVQRWIYN